MVATFTIFHPMKPKNAQTKNKPASLVSFSYWWRVLLNTTHQSPPLRGRAIFLATWPTGSMNKITKKHTFLDDVAPA